MSSLRSVNCWKGVDDVVGGISSICLLRLTFKSHFARTLSISTVAGLRPDCGSLLEATRYSDSGRTTSGENDDDSGHV